MSADSLIEIEHLDDCPRPDPSILKHSKRALTVMADGAKAMRKNAAPPQWEGNESELASHLMTRTADRLDGATGGLVVGVVALTKYSTTIENVLRPQHSNYANARDRYKSEAESLQILISQADGDIPQSMAARIAEHNRKVADLNKKIVSWNGRLESEQRTLVAGLRKADSVGEGRDVAKKMADAGYSVSTPKPAEKHDSALSGIGHTVLDIAGLVPGVGEPADGLNALWYELTGDHVDAGLSAAGMIPFLGWGATGGKVGRKVDELPDLLKFADDAPGPGSWAKANEHMSQRAADYQKQITGREPGEVYKVDHVKFDGFQHGALQDAKGPGYKSFVGKDGEFYDWFKGKASLLNQASRQTDVSGGTPITWSVAEKKAADAIQDMLEDEGFSNIRVVHVPAE